MNNNQTGEIFFHYHQSQICKLLSVRKLSYGWPIKDADLKILEKQRLSEVFVWANYFRQSCEATC